MNLFDNLRKKKSEDSTEASAEPTPAEEKPQKSNLRQVADIIAGINYDAALKSVSMAAVFMPGPAAVATPALLVLKAASEKYKESDHPEKEKQFLVYISQSISAETIITGLKPVAGRIPHGQKVLSLVELALAEGNNLSAINKQLTTNNLLN